MNIIRIALITLFVAVASACAAGEQTDTADAFWSEFRQAVAEENIQKIASLTRFPLKTRGVHDAMPVVTYDKEAFVEIFPLILNTEVPRQLEEGSMTLKQSILEKKALDPKDFSSEDQLWIGDFKFDQTDDGWRLSFVYWSEDQVEL